MSMVKMHWSPTFACKCLRTSYILFQFTVTYTSSVTNQTSSILVILKRLIVSVMCKSDSRNEIGIWGLLGFLILESVKRGNRCSTKCNLKELKALKGQNRNWIRINFWHITGLSIPSFLEGLKSLNPGLSAEIDCKTLCDLWQLSLRAY